MITLIAWAIALITLLAILHYAYEGIMLPAIRLQLRYRLFALRDRVRHLGEGQVDGEVFHYMQESTNNAIVVLPRFTVSLIVEGRKLLSNDPALRRRIEKRIQAVDQCPNDEIHKIRKEIEEVLLHALMWNCAGLLMYVIPWFYGVLAFKKVKEIILSIVSVPESESEKIVSLGCPA